MNLEPLETRQLLAALIEVTTTVDEDDGSADPGVGAGTSLREAINLANSTPGEDTVTFNIPGAGPHTITPITPLPAITDTVIIDGTTEPDFAGTPIVELNGSASGSGAVGLLINAGPSTIRGLVVNAWDEAGIQLGEGDGHVVEGNYIGSDVAGAVAVPNGIGIKIKTANNTIGRGTAGNLISGNRQVGVSVATAAATGNKIRGNLIGTDATGSLAMGNRIGIEMIGVENTVGGASGNQGNVISGNVDTGVLIRSNNNTVQGNRIGTNQAGTAAVPNAIGVHIVQKAGNMIGGRDTGAGNQISGNHEVGIYLQGAGATENSLQGNLIGLDASGTGPLGNRDGVYLNGTTNNTIGGAEAGEGNVISGNGRGINLRGSTIPGAGGLHVIRGNRIGTNRDGTAAVANVRGILINARRATHNVVDDNLISGNIASGVRVQSNANDNIFTRNLIGTNAVGNVEIPNGAGILILRNAEGNTIGGDRTAGEGNLISGNLSSGILIKQTKGNSVLGNLIGTDATGTAALGNGKDGIRIAGTRNENFIGGAGTGQGNVISGNADYGVLVVGNFATIQGNRIGTDQDGTAAISNGVGVLLRGGGSEVGGAAAGAGNQISGNAEAGVRIERRGGSNNSLQGNSIGLDAAATGPLGNKFGVVIEGGFNNMIGGAAAGAGNVISGNRLHGVFVKSSRGPSPQGNRIEGNRIGTNAAGTGAVGNGGQGVLLDNALDTTVGGTLAGAGNVISGNAVAGVKIIGPEATGNLVLGNAIGTGAAGTTPIANRDGLLIGNEAADNSVGDGTEAGSNTIAHNTRRGVWINANAGAGNSVRHNSMHDNGSLGIALSTVGVLPNDAGDPDVGPNNLQNTPEIQSVVENGIDMLDVTLLVDSTPTNSAYDLAVEIFIADNAGQEGETFLAAVPYTAVQAGTAIVVTIPKGAAVAGTAIVATATDDDGNTSEFSAPALVSAMPPAPAAAISSGGDATDLVDAAFAESGQA